MAEFRTLRGENKAKMQDHNPGSDMCSEESHVIQPWKYKGSRRVG